MFKVDRSEPELDLGHRAASCTVAVGVAAWLVSSDWWRCPMVVLFDQPCPTCGVSRALGLLASGRFADSLMKQPLAVPALCCFVLLLALAFSATLRGDPAALVRSGRARGALASIAIIFVLLLALWSLRALGHCGGPVAI